MWHVKNARELQNETFLPKVGLEPTTSCLLDLSSNQLRHETTWNNMIANIYRYTLHHVVR